MIRYATPLNIVYAAVLALTTLVIFGLLPRDTAFVILALYIGYVIFAPTQNSVALYLRSIPLFVALPITIGFDNLNTWRVVLSVIFVKWAWEHWRDYAWLKTKVTARFLGELWRKHKAEMLGITLFALASVSAFGAFDFISGAKRIIFFTNAALLLIVIRDLLRRSRDDYLFKKFAWNFALSAIVAVVFGFAQYVAAYFTAPYQFHYWWGQVVSLNQYGQNWADIVTNLGNTWFSYSAGGLRLRMFSTFPDSHSFPLYILMALPALFIVLRERYRNIAWLVVFLGAHLALILSGTRGIWASVIFPLAALPLFWKFLPKARLPLRQVGLSFFAFLLLLPAAWWLTSFTQFQETTAVDASVFGERLRSVIDFGETSNRGRIEIWQKTLVSIAERPLLGVGVGNFPRVLNQPISAMLAGSSAHNLFLQIASTMGLPALIVFLWFLWEIGWRCIHIVNKNGIYALYAAATLMFLLWVMGYSLTDAALYDGRALLGFAAMIGLLLGIGERQRE